jgi:riboflavin biosynthesis pyrimidine reductase
MAREPDLIAYRQSLGKPRHPLQVVVTESGDIDSAHALFRDPEMPVIIATTHGMLEKLRAEFIKSSHITVLSAGSDSVDFDALFRHLKQSVGVRQLDVCVGGNVAAQLLELRLINEVRMTITGQLCGPINMQGEQRPTLLPGGRQFFTAGTNPHLVRLGMRCFGDYFTFIRSRIVYRHD